MHVWTRAHTCMDTQTHTHALSWSPACVFCSHIPPHLWFWYLHFSVPYIFWSAPWKTRSFLEERREGDSGKIGILLLWASSCVTECRTISMGQGQEVHARKLIQMSMQQVCNQGPPLFWIKHYHSSIHLVYLGSDSNWKHPSSDVHFPFVLHGQAFGHLWTLYLRAVFLLVAL